jgi:hypothetical protein
VDLFLGTFLPLMGIAFTRRDKPEQCPMGGDASGRGVRSSVSRENPRSESRLSPKRRRPRRRTAAIGRSCDGSIRRAAWLVWDCYPRSRIRRSDGGTERDHSV